MQRRFPQLRGSVPPRVPGPEVAAHRSSQLGYSSGVHGWAEKGAGGGRRGGWWSYKGGEWRGEGGDRRLP